MWVDDQGVMHTVWVPPEAVLGADTVAALSAVSDEVAATTIDELDRRYEALADEAAAQAPRGPVDFAAADLDAMPYPPVIPGLAPQPGEPLAATVLRFAAAVPPIWRVEVIEAVTEVLDRSAAASDADDVDGQSA